MIRLLPILLIAWTCEAFAGSWTSVRAGYTTGYDYPYVDGTRYFDGANNGAFTGSFSVATESQRWAPGAVASFWVFQDRENSTIEGPDYLYTTRLAMLGPVLRLTLGGPDSKMGIYFEAGPSVVWMDVHIRNEDSWPGYTTVHIRESNWLAGLRLSGAVPIATIKGGRLELGVEYLHTQDFNMPADSELYDLAGVKELGAILGFAW